MAAQILGRAMMFRDDPFLRRQIEANGCAHSRLAGNGDAAAVISDDSVNPGQTQTAMIGSTFGCKKRFENSRQHFGFDPRAGVGDFGANVSAGHQTHVAVLSRLFEQDVTGLNGDPPLAVDGLDRVFENAQERLLNLEIVKSGGEQAAFELQSPRDRLGRGSFLKKFDATLHDRIQVAFSLCRRFGFLAAEAAEIIRDFGGAAGRFLDFEQRFTPRVGRFELAQNQRGMAQDTRQHVVKIQGNTARELQRTIQFLFLGVG